MPSLIIQLVALDLTPQIRGVIKDELQIGGVAAGLFHIGGITGNPDMIYFLWHLAGEVPVTMMIRRDSMDTVETARAAARDFLLKWNQRAG